MGVWYQAESFLTACISLVHEPHKPWLKQQPSCTNSRKELRRYCSPIGYNNTYHFLFSVRNQHSLCRLEMVRWESVPRAFPPVLENVCRAFSPGPTDRPWVSEDELQFACNPRVIRALRARQDYKLASLSENYWASWTRCLIRPEALKRVWILAGAVYVCNEVF